MPICSISLVTAMRRMGFAKEEMTFHGFRGMASTIYANLKKTVSHQDVHDCLAAFYANRPFIRITDNGRPPDTAHVRGTNLCDIGFVLEKGKNRVILMSVIDNLVKGAAGQAVQNMNLMMGLDESVGLDRVPFPI